MSEDYLEIEGKGYKNGLNPMMGEFAHEFCFEPIPYGHREHQDFTKSVHKELANTKYVYFGEVKVDINLYLNETKRLETPELADLDNYAKLLCDSLKGPNGLLIDDSQIQTLSVLWVDTSRTPYFEIRIKGDADEFLPKPITLYEMPDHLFYPISSKTWTKFGVQDRPKSQTELLLAATYEMVKVKKDFRHELRQSGKKPLKAFSASRYLAPILVGFHKTRVIDSGFTICFLREWKITMDFEKSRK